MDAYYTEVYKSHLLPPLEHTLRNADLSINERCKAIKYLADGSLALTGSGAGWSAALGDSLLRSAEESIISKLFGGQGRNSERSNLFAQQERPPEQQQQPAIAKVCGQLRLRRRSIANAKFAGQFHLLQKRIKIVRRRRSSGAGRFKRTARRAKDLKPRRGATYSRLALLRALEDQRIVDSRFKALQGLVPGGRDMNCSVLLGEAADYMMFLKFQVGVLQSLASALEIEGGSHSHQQQQQQQYQHGAAAKST